MTPEFNSVGILSLVALVMLGVLGGTSSTLLTSII